MALTRITKGVIKPNENYDTHNINSTGIITATKFVGQADISGGSIVGTAATFTGPVTIGGTLTYEDVTNIDSVGIITARDGLKVLAGGANVVGVVTATTFKGDGDFVELDVDGHTNLDNVSIAGVTTFAGTSVNLETGNASTQMQLRFGTNAEKSRITVVGAVNDGYTGSTVGETVFNTNSQLTLAAGGSQALTISSARKVGINTTILTEQLEVDGDIRVRNAIKFREDNGTETGNISLTDDDNLTIQSYGTSGHITFDTGSSAAERLRIESGGNVGINTTNPAKTLDVYGSFQVKDSGGATRLLVHEDSGQFEVNQSVPTWSNTTHDPSPLLKWGWKSSCGNYMFTASGGNAAVGSQMSHIISENHGFKVGRSGYDGTDGDISSTAEYFRITNAGKVGIGTNSPSFFTHIQGDGVTNDVLKITARGSGQMVNIQNHSNVPNIVRFSNYLGNAFWDAQYNTDNSFSLDYQDGEKFRITSTGKVLIGDGTTYNPQGLLHIVGDDNSNGPELYLQVNNNNTTDNIGALWFGNNVDKSLVKLAGHTHTANNTADFTVSTSSGGTLAEVLRITSGGHLYHTGGGNGRRYSFASDGSSHYMKHDTTLNGIILNGYGGITFETNGTNERLRINSSGQVSIGNNPTVASDELLHLHLDGTREYLRLVGTPGTSNAYIEIEAPTNRRKAIIFKSGGTRRAVIGLGDGDEAANDTSLFLSASTNIGGNSPHMVITSAGKVGINETSPSANLHVEQDNAHASTYYLNTDAALLIQNKNSTSTSKTVLKLEGPNSSPSECAIVYGGGSSSLIIADRQNERLRITAAGIIQCGTSGTLKAEINNAVSGHQFISQCDDNNNGFEVYQQHGTTSTRNTFAVYANTGSSSAKQSQFLVKGDNSVHIYGNKNTNHLNISSAISPSGAHSYGDEARIQFYMYNEVPQFTGNPAATIASYLHRGNNGFGLRFYARHSAGTLFNSLELDADYRVQPGVDGVADLGSDSRRWRRSFVKNAYPILSTTQNITGSSFSNQGWYDTGFRRDWMGGLDTNGTYIITAFADTHAAGGGNYSCTYTWIVGIRDQSTNQGAANDVPLLSVTGHSTNNQTLALRTVRQYSSSGGSEWIQWKASSNWSALDNSSSGRILRFVAQRIGRVY